MPIVAFVLLAVVCLALLGFACACLNVHPMQALERSLGAIPALPALIELWSALVLASFGAGFLIVYFPAARARAPSAATLQRFRL